MAVLGALLEVVWFCIVVGAYAACMYFALNIIKGKDYVD